MRMIVIYAAAITMSIGTMLGAEDTGKMEYDTNCATCHGEYGKGEGELAELLTVEVPDLTKISERNDGTFPMLDVIHVIDGRTELKAHGTVMPIWGDRFTTPIEGTSGPYAAETIARGRILAIAYYLEAIQE